MSDAETWLPSSDRAYVEQQYRSECNLAARASVWVDEGTHPTDVAVEAVKAEEPRLVLDIGCGQGALAERIAAETGAQVIAADMSPRMVELASARGLRAEIADVQALPFGDDTFDCVVAAWMLYHAPNLDLAISELARVTRPGGLLVAITNGPGHLSELWDLVDRPPLVLSFSSQSGLAQLQRHFNSVERHDLPARAYFPDRETAARYLSSLLDGDELIVRLPIDWKPFDAHGEPTVFLARR